jgi:hypothetical protein
MPSCQDLGNGLMLRSVRSEADVEGFIALNEAVTGEGAICDRLLRHHPETSLDDYLLVEDRRAGRVVSTTCLIPWRCRYEEIDLDVAMVEMVVTHPGYRRRGLVRAQIERLHRVMDERGFDLGIVQGIPYYYRQYGYAYALDHRPADSLPARHIPEGSPDGESAFRVRPAALADVAELVRLYDEAGSGWQVTVRRSPAYWCYLLERMRYPVRVVEEVRTGRTVGYLSVTCPAHGHTIEVGESGILTPEAGWAVLRHLKAETIGEVLLTGPATGTLVCLARGLGSDPIPAGQWLLRLADAGRFLSRVGPVLERRVARSDCAGLTATLTLNFYRRAIGLCFREGKLEGVEPLGFVDASMGTDGGDLCIPPEAFVRLAFGYRGLDDLRDAWPDTVVRGESRRILDVLFPRLEAALWMPY